MRNEKMRKGQKGKRAKVQEGKLFGVQTGTDDILNLRKLFDRFGLQISPNSLSPSLKSKALLEFKPVLMIYLICSNLLTGLDFKYHQNHFPPNLKSKAPLNLALFLDLGMAL